MVAPVCPLQVGAPGAGELRELEDKASWCDWADGSMEQKLLKELKEKGGTNDIM